MRRMIGRGSVLAALAALAALGVVAAIAADSPAKPAEDKYVLRVPGGLAFSEFRGYESWQTISVSHNGPRLAVILGNPAMIDAFKAGIPANGKPFPNGAKMAKVHWAPMTNTAIPGQPLQPAEQTDVDFMVKDSQRFSDSGGWGYAAFEYDAAAGKFHPATEANTPPQSHDAKCGFACHTIAKKEDYVFTKYASR